MKKQITFEKDLYTCLVGKTRIDADAIGRPVTVIRGRMTKHCDDARKFVDENPSLKAAFAAWWQWRTDEINKWRKETPHNHYACDGGTITMLLNGSARVQIGNGYGDGIFPLYVVRDSALAKVPVFPPTFINTGISLSGPCVVEPLDYDCKGGKPLRKIELVDGEMMMVFRDRGAIALAIYGND